MQPADYFRSHRKPEQSTEQNDTYQYPMPALPAKYMTAEDRLTALELEMAAMQAERKEQQRRMKRLHWCMKAIAVASWAVLAPFLAQVLSWRFK